MKPFKILLFLTLLLFPFSTHASTADFNWTEDFNIQARANPIGFRASLAARFGLGTDQTHAVINRFDSPADAYIVLRLGEISGKPEAYIVDKYRRDKDKGWGPLAQNLGINPGSAAFHALKLDHDLRADSRNNGTRNFSPDRAMLLMLTQTVCKVEAENRAVW